MGTREVIVAGDETNAREAEIGRILNDYLDRKGRGEAVSEQEFLQAHPDLATDLRSHFDLVREMAPALAGGTTDGGNGQMAIPHDSLPGYEILSEIHRGGQGVVYQAYQKSTRRKVAVKVMREGAFAGRRDRARFEREVQILGSLRHPHIVSIHDSGVAGGSHFFVMDYVPGQPLDLWISSGPRSVQQILNLFVKICDAVNAAHLRGIVHRDLKPSNVRIGSDGEPHILDFGLAKLADAVDPDGPTMTTTGQFVGSLPWASPEQAQGEIEQVDTRTDVYALGVVLYQLLTGRFPYEVVGSMRDVLNRIVGEEPARPSTIRSEVDNEVETIVLKCLAKEPARRYQTAGELGRDIERYLRGEPITAKSDSGMYVLKKLLRRHRAVVAACLSFVLLLSISLIGSTILWRDAATARDRALEAEQKERSERSRADAQALEAEQARKVAEQRADELNRTAYINRIALAHSACEDGYFTRAMQMLDQCSPELRGWEWGYLRRRAGMAPLLDIAAHSPGVITLLTSRDGKHVMTVDENGFVKQWGLADGTLQKRVNVDRAGAVSPVCLSPDGNTLAFWSRNRTIRVWDLHAGRQIAVHALTASEAAKLESDWRAACLAFPPDGKLLLAGTPVGTVEAINLESGTSTSFRAHGGSVKCIAFSPDGEVFATGEHLPQNEGMSEVRLWNVKNLQRLWSVPAAEAGVYALAFNPDGRRLAVGSCIPNGRGVAEGTLRILDTRTGDEVLSTRGHEGFVHGLAFSPDGHKLASVGAPRSPYGRTGDNTLKIWNAATGEQITSIPAHSEAGSGVAWSPDGQRIISVGNDGALRVWADQSSQDARILDDSFDSAGQVAFSPDGKRILSGELRRVESRANRLRVWNVETLRPLLTIDAHQASILSVAWSPDGRVIASSGNDSFIRLWNSGDGRPLSSIEVERRRAWRLMFSPDSTLLAAQASVGACVYRVADQSVVFRIQQQGCSAMAFSPDGSQLAIGIGSDDIHVYRTADWVGGQRIRVGQKISCLAFAGNRGLACGDGQGSLSIWDSQTGDLLAGPSPPTDENLLSIASNPDGSRIASGSADMLLRIWDTDKGAELLTVRAHDHTVMCVQFDATGRRIATCGMDRPIKIWEAADVVPTSRPAERQAPATTRPTG